MAVFGAAIEREIEEHFSERDMLHWHLHLLAVAPEWQRRGAGRLLVEWGFEQADLDGVVAAVEASVAGVGFYCKVGFGVVGETRVEFEEGVVVLPVMVRPVGGCRVGGG